MFTSGAKVLLKKWGLVAVRSKYTLHRPSWQEDVVYLVQFPVSPHIRNISPFALKLETWLKTNQIRYENVHSIKTSRKGQIPYVELNGEQIPDSNIIIQRLTDHFKTKCDANLTANQRSIAHAITVMVEHHTAQIGFYWRYGHHNYEFTDKLMENFAEKKASIFFFKYIQPSGLKTKAYLSGIGRHSFQEIEEMSFRDLDAISNLLGDKKYFLGTSKPSTIDCTLFGHLAQFLYIPMAFPQKKYMHENCPNLVQLVERIKAEIWPDWEEMCKATCMEGKMGFDFTDQKK